MKNVIAVLVFSIGLWLGIGLMMAFAQDKVYSKSAIGNLIITENKTEQKVQEYNYEYLVGKRQEIINAKDAAIAEYAKQLVEIDAMIAACKTLGITAELIGE
jgi:hypothetical protein